MPKPNVLCMQDFSVYTANTESQLADAVARKHSAWCGLSSVMSWDASSCVVSLSPFRETSVAVVHPARRGITALSQGQLADATNSRLRTKWLSVSCNLFHSDATGTMPMHGLKVDTLSPRRCRISNMHVQRGGALCSVSCRDGEHAVPVCKSDIVRHRGADSVGSCCTFMCGHVFSCKCAGPGRHCLFHAS